MKYSFNLTCPKCGGEPTHVTGSVDTPLATRHTAIADCATCGMWQVVVTLRPGPPIDRAEEGRRRRDRKKAAA